MTLGGTAQPVPHPSVGATTGHPLVLVLSASLGAGHDGAAQELARRLRSRGYRTAVVDYLACLPFGLGALVRGVYRLQLRIAPWAYEATFRVWYLGRPLRWLLLVTLAMLSGRRVRSLLRAPGLAGVVSTYPLPSMVVGRERAAGRLDVPVTTFVTDFGVHPLWISDGVDLTLCVHESSAEEARLRTGRAVVATGPAVRPGFRPRTALRNQLGLPAAAPVALIVAGSWGVGDVESTFDAIGAAGPWFPVAVCGHNDLLRRRLEARGQGLVLGWTDRMPELMAASDVLVENAGGLSCMEAFAVGLPVITYRPLAGHGRRNAARMRAAGVVRVATGSSDLEAVLGAVLGPGGSEQAAAGLALFRSDPAAEIDARIGPRVRPARHAP